MRPDAMLLCCALPLAAAATPQFAALYGSFPDRDSADAALATLPEQLRFKAPRMRRFGMVQDLLGEVP
ncbi:MAG: hypothetical protein IT494_08790 [Gammaproteobacteria bacterium]|nr:hypothetical protein [Gammaproteobacteria bacterium]